MAARLDEAQAFEQAMQPAVAQQQAVDSGEARRIDARDFLREFFNGVVADLLPKYLAVRRNAKDDMATTVVEHGAQGACTLSPLAGSALEFEQLGLPALRRAINSFKVIGCLIGLAMHRAERVYWLPLSLLFGGLRQACVVAWTPTGTNVPDYPKLAQLWWKNVAVAVTGEKTPQAAMDNLANEMDDVMGRLERAGMANCPPKLNPKGDPNKYLSDKGAPWKKLANEKPKGETINYDKLLGAWKEGKVR